MKFKKNAKSQKSLQLIFLSSNSCWLISDWKLCMYERSKRGKTLPDVDTCSFAQMFQQAMQDYTSSTQLFNP